MNDRCGKLKSGHELSRGCITVLKNSMASYLPASYVRVLENPGLYLELEEAAKKLLVSTVFQNDLEAILKKLEETKKR